MMRRKALTSRYAEAFWAFARERLSSEEALSCLKDLRALLRSSRVLRQALVNPGITFEDKCAIIAKIMPVDFPAEACYFLRLLISRGRLDYFFEIAEYLRTKYGHGRRQEALIKTTFPLGLGLVEKIQAAIEKRFSQKFKFYLELDSSLLGGIQIIIGNRIIDGSVKRRLGDLKEKLSAVNLN